MTDIPTTETYQTQQLTDRIAILDKTVDELRKDIQVIGEALMTEAADRGWCSEYDHFVDSVNNDLKRSSLPTRTKDYTASVRFAISFEAPPAEYEDKLTEILRALHRHGDNLGEQTYTIGDYDIDHIEAD